ncbi:MAG TPA: hypothetical protein VND64_10755 [Pirellulales bacterium]|nr:hypothetical protein [Pirellulales bacterium]
MVVGIAYAVDKPLFPRGTIPEQHTHVFDVYCAPFHGTGDATPAEVWRQLHEHLAPFEMVGTVILGGLFLTGLALRRFDGRWRIEDWLQRPPVAVSHAPAWHSRPLPAPVLGGTALLGLLALSGVGCFIYYPEAKESIEQMRVIKTEALTAALGGEEELAEHWIEAWDDWTRRLQVGVYLRQGGLSESQRREAQQLRDDLELLDHSVEEDDREAVRRHAASVEATYQRLRAAYLAAS